MLRFKGLLSGSELHHTKFDRIRSTLDNVLGAAFEKSDQRLGTLLHYLCTILEILRRHWQVSFIKQRHDNNVLVINLV